MARRKHVEISDEQYEKVITHLDGGGTKKAACEMVGIAYNTKRLDNLIKEWLYKKEYSKTMRAKKRKEAVTEVEVAGMITDYLAGCSLSQLSDTYYRSINMIRYHLDKHGAMLRVQKVIDPLNPPLLPEECVSDSFSEGEYVWSAKYNCVAKVMGFYKNAYRIVTMGGEEHRFQAYQPSYELGKLKHLFDLGVKPENIYANMLEPDEITYRLNEAVKNGNKRK